MKTLQGTLAWVLLGLGASALAALAQESEHKLSDFSLGEHVSGEKVNLDKMDGKVVVIEYWGTR